MNRDIFMEELQKRLRKLPYGEIKEALDYYEQYFDDAGAENEQEVLSELGAPSAVAAQIIAGFAVKGAGMETSAKKKLTSAWIVALALLASPIALPLAIAAGAVALAFIISVSAVFISFLVTGVALFAGGIVCVVAGIVVVFQSFPTTLFMLGCGLILAGLGAAAAVATLNLSKLCFGWLAGQIGNFILRRNAK